MREICAISMVVVVVSFIGFCVENIWLAFTKGFMDNRNMSLPFLFGYGLAMILVYILFGLPHRPKFFGKEVLIITKLGRYLYYYFVIMICILVGELALGTAVEKICGYQWWNYSWIPLHITQYTSIPTSLGFSAIVFLFMNYCFEPLMNFFIQLNEFTLIQTSGSLMTGLTVDLLYNLQYMYRNGCGKVRWRINTDEIIEKIKRKWR